jgi:hypothetical protein
MKSKYFQRSLFGSLCVLFLLALGSGMSGENPEPQDRTHNLLAKQDRVEANWWMPKTLLLGVADSLGQGTMDAVNNQLNTQNAFMEKIYLGLRNGGLRLKFAQPYLNLQGSRINPFLLPTNLSVDGEDIFSVDGLEYGKRAGQPGNNNPTDNYYCDRLQSYLFADMHDKVLYPINLWAGQKVSQVDALIWHLNRHWGPAYVCFWIGNNDSGLAALGLGGKNPEFLPIPFEQIKDKLKLGARYLLQYGANNNVLSFTPFNPANIERNLTDYNDFMAQFQQVSAKISSQANLNKVDFFVMNYPYYCDVGYLFPKEDISAYLASASDPDPVPDFEGSVSLLTFLCMYVLYLEEGSASLPDILAQPDLILDTEERNSVRARIDEFNSFLLPFSAPGDQVHLVDIATDFNVILNGGSLPINGENITRQWGRGGGFSMDGVHPSYTAHAVIANRILSAMSGISGKTIPLHDEYAAWLNDPYVDHDGDGWVAGPAYEGSGRTRILFLFKDNDGDDGSDGEGQAVIDTMQPAEIWELISDALLEEIIDIPLIRAEAARKGFLPIEQK